MVAARLKMVLSTQELNRLKITETSDGLLRITADVHGMTCHEARRFINNIINLVRVAFRLIIIHGYNHGTAIKDMLAWNFNNTHITERHPDPWNQGVTYMSIAA